MAHRGVDTLRFGPMKPVGLDRSAHRPRAVRRRAAAAGQSRRRSLQPRRLPDADQMGRAGARAAADSRAWSRPSSCASAWCTATPTSTARRCSRETWQVRARPTLFFAGQMSGVEGLRRVGGVGPARRDERRRAGDRRSRSRRRRGRRRSARSRYYVSHADPGALRAVEHHLRHHGAARRAPKNRRGAEAGDRRARAGRSRRPGSRRDSAVGAPRA